PVEIVIRISPIPVVRLGGARGKSYSAKATVRTERDRQCRDEKEKPRDRSEVCHSNVEFALTHFVCPLSEIGSSGWIRCGHFLSIVAVCQAPPRPGRAFALLNSAKRMRRTFRTPTLI